MGVRDIYIIGSIEPDTLRSFAYQFRKADAKKGPITVHISSGGGDVDAGMGIYELIRTSRNQVTTHGFGNVSGIAVMIFAAGDERVLTEGTSLLVHDGTLEVSGALRTVKSEIDENYRLHTKYCDAIAGAGGVLSSEDVRTMASKETYIDARLAGVYEIATKVVPYRKRM